MMHDENKIKTAILPLIFTVFIDLLGLGIVIPIFAVLFFTPQGPFYGMYSIKHANLLYGLLIASYPLATFIAAPILGDLSDRFGRKKILLGSIIGTFIGYLIITLGILTNNLLLLFLGRSFDGFTGGNISVANSAIADLSSPETKARNFGLIGMAFGFGFIIGPYVGGKLSDPTVVSWFDFSTPFIFSSVLTLINIVFIIFLLPETLKVLTPVKISLWRAANNIIKVAKMHQLRDIFITVFLFTFGFNFFTQFYQVYLIDKFDYNQSQIGDMFAYIGLWIALVQGVVVRFLTTLFKPRQILRYSILLLSLVFPLLLVPDKAIYLYFIVPFLALFNGITFPNLTATVSNMAGADAQGEVLGMNQSVQSLAQAIPPIIAGIILSININLPIVVAGVMTFFAWLAYLFSQRDKSDSLIHQR